MSEYGKGYIAKSALLDAVDWDNDIEKWVILDDDLQSLMTQKNDVVDVTRGHWLFCGEDGHGFGLWRCTHCGNVTGEKYRKKHCPSCGARMDGGDKPRKEIPEEYSREPGAGGWDCSDEEYNYSGYVRDVLNGGW